MSLSRSPTGIPWIVGPLELWTRETEIYAQQVATEWNARPDLLRSFSSLAGKFPVLFSEDRPNRPEDFFKLVARLVFTDMTSNYLTRKTTARQVAKLDAQTARALMRFTASEWMRYAEPIAVSVEQDLKNQV